MGENNTKAMKKLNISLENEVKSLKYKLTIIENEQRENSIKNETLQDLYLSPKRIKNFTASIKKYGKEFELLKQRQYNLSQCIGKENNESIKIRMNAFYRDIVQTEASYRSLNECLDVISTESAGKELEL